VTKLLFALVAAALAAAAVIVPAPQPPQPDPAAAVDLPSVSICPVDEGSGRSTTVAVLSTAPGSGQFTAFLGGSAAGSAPFQTGASGAAEVPVADVAPVGLATGLVEMPAPESAGAAFVTGAVSVEHEVCPSAPAIQTLLAGGSTTGDREFDIQLMNPYSVEARVDLVVRSESGLESAPQLRGIAVPARSSIVVDMDEVLPGRESLAVAIETTSGNVIAAGWLRSAGDGAVWNAVPPALDWFMPVPSGGVDEIVISTSAGTDVEYQVDLYGADGLVEAFDEGLVPAHGDVDIDAEVAGTGASAFRVVSTQPVAVFLRHVGEDGLALTSGSTLTASRWLLPGAGMAPGGAGRIVVLNAGLDQTTATITALGEQTVVKGPPVRAGSVLEFAAISPAATGYTVTGEGLLVPMWVSVTDAATAYSIGVPLIDE
jgi:hypothetical protein